MADEVAATATTTTPAPVVPAPQTTTDTRPAWLPQKFKTGEDLAKSYAELEKKLGAGGKTETTSAPTSPAPLSIPDTETTSMGDLPDDAGVEALVEKAGFKPEELAAAWQAKGELTPDMYAGFKKIGIPKGIVNDFIKTQAATAQAAVNAAKTQAESIAGGPQQLKNLLAWGAQGGLTKEEIVSINADLANPATTVAAVERLMGKHTRAVGSGRSAPLVSGESGAAMNEGAFQSLAEALSVKGDKRMKIDPSFAANYRKRLAKTPNSVLR